MPNIKSAKKRVLVNKAKALRNQAAKSELKTAIKKFNAACDAGDKAAANELYKAAVKKVDQAVARGILHKNSLNDHLKGIIRPPGNRAVNRRKQSEKSAGAQRLASLKSAASATHDMSSSSIWSAEAIRIWCVHLSGYGSVATSILGLPFL